MALEFVKDPGSGVMVEATARLCLTEDDKLVPEGDPEGRWLYCIPGRMIPRAEAEKYGLLQHAAESEPEPEPPRDETPAASSDDVPTVAEPPKAPDLKAVRAWAIEQGLDVPKRGSIPEAVVELYNEEHQEN